MTVHVTNKLVEQTGSSFEYMVDRKGYYSQLAAEAAAHGSFHEVALNDNNSVEIIPSAQFFRSLANNLRAHMLTTTSLKGESHK